MIRDNVEEELIWIASSRDGYKLVSYTFAEQEDVQFDKIIKQKKVSHPKLCVTVSTVIIQMICCHMQSLHVHWASS